MKIFDCFMYFDEEIVLDLRLNLLDKYVDYFVIIESNFNHKGEKRKLKFDPNKFKKFKDKIIYLVYDEQPKDLYIFKENDENIDIISKNIFNAGKRENAQRNLILNGLKNAKDNDIILVSDVDEIPNLSNINFEKFHEKIIIFKQHIFYYKFNLKLPNFIWTGTKGCKKKNLINPQWLRNIKDRKFAFYRIDTFFSENKYMNVKIVEDGGWHFTNIKTAEEIELKLKSYLHHVEFDENPLSIDQIKKIINDKVAIYNLNVDQTKKKFGKGDKLEKFQFEKLPEYIQNNPEIYKNWLD